ncbi:putative indole-3-acetic acid-amido synthetase GH3.6 [Sesamum alatum]|uniref:Indole-3-acetic acid-amido synthetase GH3.6 n=1 Tax=Sesamum alatum TaxID=300844 RepID=A0AAE2CDK6_9LAMI|nr:putative indole-3-acetic acid-amido synthetase GH3.6 [Sesamum alatum]
MTDVDVIEKLEDTFRDAMRRQLETLSTILERNGGVSYLQPYLRGYKTPLDAATFRSAVPLSCYDDYADHISKLADGVLRDDHGQPLLSVDPLLCFFYSSGTSSMKPKLIPCFDSKPGRAVSSLAHQGSTAILERSFPPRSSANKVLGFLYAGNVTRTNGGFMAMAATAFPLYSNNPNTSRFLSGYVSPKEVFLGTDVNQQMYCHLLCGLRHFDRIDGIRAPYAAGLIKAFSLLETHWKKLSEDLENGLPSSEVSDSTMRQSVIEILGGPRPDLSERVRLICEETSWGGIVGKLWPNARYVKSVTTGSMVQYYPKLKYYAGEIPILGSDYFASECCVAINLDIVQPLERTHYVILPTAAYFEFLPFDVKRTTVKKEQTVDLSGLEVGKLYELVVTTFRGLYRLRLGDIVKVVGFHHTSPQIEFVMRAPKSSDEIITEKDLLSAMGSFQLLLRDELAADVLEFSSFMDLESEPKKLKIFFEVKDESSLLQNDKFTESIDALRKCCSVLEDGLGGMYQVMKARGEVGPLSASIVKPGTFDRLLEEAIKNGAPASQYKPPKIIRNCKLVDYLEMSAVLSL